MTKYLRLIYALMLLFSTTSVLAVEFSHPSVNQLLKADVAPDGVVFELLSYDEKTWQWAAPMINSLRQQLKTRFPEIDIAVVSHGAEQFQLMKSKQLEQPKAIAQLSQLTDEGVNLHVCGTHSSWQDVPENAYLDIVNVSPSGPAQINDYIKLGYKHILLQKPL
jgi:intracellular sulfur oxidation DsrE/DsrF family protein